MTGATAQILAQLAECLSPSQQGAKSLPPAAYGDEGLFERERAAIFHRSWLCVGRADAFAAAGDYLSLSLAGEPVLVIRGHDGTLRAFSNVCRHRLFPLLPDGSGAVRRLTCPYHLWVYGLDGRLAGAPFMEATPGFDRAACALPAFAVETWLGFVFVNLDADAAPLAPNLSEIEERLANHEIANAVPVAHYRKTWNGNWKLAVENASESYHHPGLHATTVQPYLPAAGTRVVELTDHWAQHETPLIADAAAAGGLRRAYPTPLTPKDRAAMKVFTIFPSFVLLTVGDLIQYLSFVPLAVDRVDVLVETLYPPAALNAEPDLEAMRGAVSRAQDLVNAEDELATSRLQAAAASRFAARGWLSEKEGVLAGFHAWLARALCAGQIRPG